MRRDLYFFALLAFIAAVVQVRMVGAPSYTDAFYHFNAAQRFAAGEGLTDTYLWTYLGAPDAIRETGDFPSHLYWMPLTSTVAALGMTLFGADYASAAVVFIPMLWCMMLAAYWTGARLGQSRRHAWTAGLLAVFSGFFVRFWGATDTFAPYAFAGAACLLALGLAHERGNLTWWALAGVFGALAHLTRADGLLLPAVGLLLIGLDLVRRKTDLRRGFQAALVLTGAYLLAMSPWFVRNLSAIGTFFPVGGVQGVWYTEYNDLFAFPPVVLPENLLQTGVSGILATRWEAFTNNLATFLAVEGWIVGAPLMLIGAWTQRKNRWLQPFIVYAIGLHVAMTLVFPFPGYRGGLFHSAAALIPFWAALAVSGLDTLIDFVARHRRRWNPVVARSVFSGALVIIAAGLTLLIGSRGSVPGNMPVPSLYSALQDALPADARLLINDPAQLYYWTGMGGSVLPNAPADVIPEIARRYRISHVVIEYDADGRALTTTPLLNIAEDLPSFLLPVPIDHPTTRVYAIQTEPLPAG